VPKNGTLIKVVLISSHAPDGAEYGSLSIGKKSPPAAPIDLNRATAEELQQLPGVGPVTSQRIVATRAAGPFKTVDELRRVSGIGAKTLEKLRPFITVGSSTGDDPPANTP
jgi:competence protein ComEA